MIDQQLWGGEEGGDRGDKTSNRLLGIARC